MGEFAALLTPTNPDTSAAPTMEVPMPTEPSPTALDEAARLARLVEGKPDNESERADISRIDARCRTADVACGPAGRTAALEVDHDLWTELGFTHSSPDALKRAARRQASATAGVDKLPRWRNPLQWLQGQPLRRWSLIGGAILAGLGAIAMIVSLIGAVPLLGAIAAAIALAGSALCALGAYWACSEGLGEIPALELELIAGSASVEGPAARAFLAARRMARSIISQQPQPTKT